MPFLRFTRDKRGYENTSIVHTFRRRGASRPRILYWFRTPPNVRIGRVPLDEEAIRAIEESHPGVAFDWPKIFEAHPRDPLAESDQPKRAGRAEVARRGGKQRPRRRRAGDKAAEAEPAAPAAPAPARLEEEAYTTSIEEPAFAVTGPEPVTTRATPVEALAGAEASAVLRAKYEEVKARIAERVNDPVRQEALREQAERLNPDAWVTAEEARAGLEQFETLYQSLRAALGRRRRRSRRGGARRRKKSGGGGTRP